MILNQSQQKAVNALNGHYLVIAGPGSGKTMVIIERILKLIRTGEDPQTILIITFTNKAAFEIKKRLKEALGYIPKVEVTTFHSFCYRQLLSLYSKEDRKKVRPINENESKKIIREILKNHNIKQHDKDVLKYFRAIRNKFKSDELEENIKLLYASIFEEYEVYCLDHYYIDYDDMIYWYKNQMKNVDYKSIVADGCKYIMVDECQDINRLQYDLLLDLESEHHNLYMVGDPDQAIYQWRGTDSSLINEFMNQFSTKTIFLNENYRSDGNIVDCTYDLITKNPHHIDRAKVAMRKRIIEPEFHEFRRDIDESAFIASMIKERNEAGIPYDEIMALYRTHKDAKALEIVLKKQGIPYVEDKANFFSLEEIEIIKNYYHLILNHHDDQAFMFVHDKPCCGIQLQKALVIASNDGISLFEALTHVDDKKSNNFISNIEYLSNQLALMNPFDFFDELIKVMNILDYCIFKRKEALANLETFKELLEEINKDNLLETYKDFFTGVYFSDVKDDKQGIRLMTIHQAKGLEARCVFVMGMKTYANLLDIPSEEERRIWYVAATRAKDYLYCSFYKMNSLQKMGLKKSIYFKEISSKGKVIRHA